MSKERQFEKSKKFALLTGAVVGATAIAAHVMKKKAEKTTYEADLIEPIEKEKWASMRSMAREYSI